MLTDFVLRYTYGSSRPHLPRGNYVEVRANENNLMYSEFIIDDLYAKVIPTAAFAVCLYDSLGNIISDAAVTLGKRSMPYDGKLHYYKSKSANTDDVVSILHRGVYHYLRVDRNWPYAEEIPFWRKLSNSWVRTKYSVENVFCRKQSFGIQNFIVFSKPMYKPNEKVKFKAYIEKGKWNPYKDSINVRLIGDSGYAKDTVITKLTPYRPGMFNHSFDINSGLDLTLDKYYDIALESTRTKEILLRGSFRYEDYELKSISFSMKSDRTDFAKGDSIRLKLKAVNENQMPIYDGRVDLKIVPKPTFSAGMKSNQVSFISDTLWQTTISLTEVEEKEIVLPDSIFPKDIGLSFQVIGTYLSSDNERHERTLNLSVLDAEKEIRVAVKSGQAEIKYVEKGVEKTGLAKIEILGENDEILKAETITLPHLIPLPWQATEIDIMTNGIRKIVDLEEEESVQLSYRFYRTSDSVILNVNNPAALPFWYEIRKANKTVASGYDTKLNRTFPEHGKEGYSMQIVYLFGGRSKVIKENLPFVQKNLNLEVSTATTVYPGQKAEVKLSVTDKAGKPLKDVDITAYGFTSKFESASSPNISIGGVMRSAKTPTNLAFELDEEYAHHNQALKDWARWSKEMHLDTIAFYQFLFPKDYYQASQPLAGGKSQIAPYIVIDGVVQGVHMMWIDGALAYARQAQHHADYVFEIHPGQHDFRFRTKDREVLVQGFHVEKERRTIVSFNAAHDTLIFRHPIESLKKGQIRVRTLPTQDTAKLNQGEVAELKKQLISVTNNFGAWQLPNLGPQVELPAYIQAADNLYYLNPIPRTTFNSRLGTQVPVPILAGPFLRTGIGNGGQKIAMLTVDTTKIGYFEIEGGYQYTLYKNYQKLKSWDTDDIRRDVYDFRPNMDFNRKVLTLSDINQNVTNRFTQVMQNSRGLAQIFSVPKDSKEPTFNLHLSLGRDVSRKAIQPTLVFIEPAKAEDRRYFRLYYGAERIFRNLPVSDIILHVIRDDSTSYSLPITLGEHGSNYLKLDSIQWEYPSTTAALAYKLVHNETIVRTVSSPLQDLPQNVPDIGNVLSKIDKNEFIARRKNSELVRILVYDGDIPLIGARIKNKASKKEYFTGFDGSVDLDFSGEHNVMLEIVSLGYDSSNLQVSAGKDYFVELQAQEHQLDEVVVMGYAVQKNMTMTASITNTPNISSMLQGNVAGILIRGTNSDDVSAKPLILVDGIPFEGDLSALDPTTIVSLNTVHDKSMMTLYGARAANGVVMVQTAVSGVSQMDGNISMPYLESSNSMRVNFHDDAFWQPILTTDAMGKASFEASYPDDITNWRTFFIAKGKKDFTDIKELNIKSFKAVSAHLATPRFAIREDRFTAIGRVVNYLQDSLQLTRVIEDGGTSQEANLKIAKSHRDLIDVHIADGDSVQLSYSISLANGYFDGEQRSIPIFEKGLEQSEGDFKVLNGPEIYQLKTSPDLGEITVHAEANSLEFIQREIEHINGYKYLCNEQLASKLSALLSKKELSKLLGKSFKNEKDILRILKALQKNRNATGGWGWWNKSETVAWISSYVVSTLLDAEEAGYKTTLDRKQYIEQEELGLKRSLASLDVLLDKDKLTVAKEGLFTSLLFLNRLDPTTDYKGYFSQIDAKLKSKSIKDKLLKYLLAYKLGVAEGTAADTVLMYASKTILGGMYWTTGQPSEKNDRIFIRPTETNTENTLLAYAVLKAAGGYQSDLEHIRNYFFAQRQNGHWANIYESARIIRSILPDLLKDGETFQAPVLQVNGKRVTTFPFTQTFASKVPVDVSKEGTGPLFVTAYQKFWNPTPSVENKKGLTVSTRFKDDVGTIAMLKEGKPITLEVSLELTGEAEYLQIEVPIPAGCSYESKSIGYYRNEAHREHFKDRVTIFCNKLNKGVHTFEIELLPRYTGAYTLNPAKAELMYFPIFYGNEKIKDITVY